MKENPEATEQKYNPLIRDLWQNGTYNVHDMRVVNTDARSHLAQKPEKCLQETAREKNKMHLEAWLQQRLHFFPFVPSVDGLLGVEAADTLKSIAIRLARKWQQPYSIKCRYVMIKIVTTLVRATHRCIRWSRVPAHHFSVQNLHWEDGSGLKLLW